jgi:hypothetical protein
MILATDKYEVALLSTPWGACPMNALSADRDMEIIQRILPRPELPRQPDVYIQVSVPSEFQKVGKFNIGYTAGIETTLASQEWILCGSSVNTQRRYSKIRSSHIITRMVV